MSLRLSRRLRSCYHIAFILFSCYVNQVQGDKYIPQKGDPYCTPGDVQFASQHGDRYPCRPTTSPDMGISTDMPIQNAGSGVQLIIYAAQAPNRPSLGQVLSFNIAAYLNQTIDGYYFLFPPNQNQELFPQSFHGGQSQGGEGHGGQRQDRQGEQGQYQPGEHGQGRWLESTNTTQSVDINLKYLRTRTSLYTEIEDTWWWQHVLDWDCIWRAGGEYITNSSVLFNVTTTIYDQLAIGIENDDILNLFTGQSRYAITDLSLSVPKMGSMPVYPEGTVAPTGAPAGAPTGTVNPAGKLGPPVSPTTGVSPAGPNEGDLTFEKYVNPSEWSPLRYVGLGLFLGTFFGTIILVVIAGRRERHRREKEFWGNLATEEGVEELLKTGWKLRGSKMEIYNKSGIGYRDDDSMLIGGYEQREAVVGAEITVTQPESVTTPDSLFR